MKQSRQNRVHRHLEIARDNRELIRIRSCPAGRPQVNKGFVVGISDDILLLHTFLIDPFIMNGYAAIRIENIRRVGTMGENDGFIARAALLRGLEPVVPEGVDVSSMSSLLSTVAEHSPILSIWEQEKDPHGCYIGRVLKVGRKRAEVRVINEEAEWSKVYRIRLAGITQVDFDTGYDRMLWQVNQAFHNTLLAHTPSVGTA